MKKVLLLIVLFTSQMMSAQNGFSFYEEDGLWGVRYNGETCLLPRFEDIADKQNPSSRFFYKENGKWGISLLWKKLTEPFCDSLACFENRYETLGPYMHKFQENGKWGVCAADGTIILPALYLDIYDIILNRHHFYDTWKAVKGKLPAKNSYFLVKDEHSCKLFDICGTLVLDNIESYEKFFFNKKSYIKDKVDKKYRKEFYKYEEARGKNDPSLFLAVESTIDAIKKKDNENGLFRKSLDFSDKKNNDKQGTPSEIWFGKKDGQLIPATGDTIIVSGLKSIVNDYGFISTPLVYDSPYFRLQRNPFDVYAYLVLLAQEEKAQYLYYGGPYKYYVHEEDIANGKVEKNMTILSNKIQSYSELMEMAKQINDVDAYKVISELCSDAQTRLSRYEDGLSRTTKLMNFNAKMDRISNAATSVLYSMANALGGNPSTSTSSYSSNSNTTSLGTSARTGNSSQMSMSDQVNYNSLRNTYNKWASDLMQMKNANGKYQNGYTQSDKQHAQSEMKRIRENAKQRWGKEIPYNSIEDWR